MEKLVDDEFEVEEKNRIRRNLEGLRANNDLETQTWFRGFLPAHYGLPRSQTSQYREGREGFRLESASGSPREDYLKIRKCNCSVFECGLTYYLGCSRYAALLKEETLLRIRKCPWWRTLLHPSFSSSKARQLDADAGNQDTFSPDFDNGHDQVPYYPRDHSFPAVYVNPAVVDKYYVARPDDDVVFMPATSPHAVGLSDAVSPTSVLYSLWARSRRF